MHSDLQSVLAHARSELERIYGDRLLKVVLYGSQARGDAHEESDVDLLVVLEGPVDWFREIDRTLALQTESLLVHGVLISLVHVSEEDYEGEDQPLMINVHREGVTV